jgi:hypothetical protein
MIDNDKAPHATGAEGPTCDGANTEQEELMVVTDNLHSESRPLPLMAFPRHPRHKPPRDFGIHHCLFGIAAFPFDEDKYVFQLADGAAVIVHYKCLVREASLRAVLLAQLGREYQPQDQEDWELELGHAAYDGNSHLTGLRQFVGEYEKYLEDLECGPTDKQPPANC